VKIKAEYHVTFEFEVADGDPIPAPDMSPDTPIDWQHITEVDMYSVEVNGRLRCDAYTSEGHIEFWSTGD